MQHNKEIKEFIESIFDDRIWHLRDVEYQQAMVRAWIELAYREGVKSLKLEVGSKLK